AIDVSWLLNAQKRGSSIGIPWRQPHLHFPRDLIQHHAFKLSAIEREPQTERSKVDPLPKTIKRLHAHNIALRREISAEGQPAKLCVLDHIHPRRPGMAKKVWPVVPCIGIEDHLVRVAVKGSGRKPFPVDPADGSHR